MIHKSIVSDEEMEADLKYFRDKLAKYKDPMDLEAIKTAKQLAILEDAIIIYRLHNPGSYDDKKED